MTADAKGRELEFPVAVGSFWLFLEFNFALSHIAEATRYRFQVEEIRLR